MEANQSNVAFDSLLKINVQFRCIVTSNLDVSLFNAYFLLVVWLFSCDSLNVHYIWHPLFVVHSSFHVHNLFNFSQKSFIDILEATFFLFITYQYFQFLFQCSDICSPFHSCLSL